MSNILFLTQVLPYPLDAGPKVRAYYMLRHLAGRHRVTLVSFVRPDDRPAYVAHLAEFCQAVHPVPIRRSPGRNIRAGVKGLLTGLPIVIARDEMAEMTATLRRLVHEERFDVIHADQLSMAGWGLLGRGAGERGTNGPRTLLDEHNAIYVLSERMAQEARATRDGSPLQWLAMQREAAAFRRYEAAMVRAYDALLTVTQEDRDHLLALFAEPERSALAGKLTVVPICVDPQAVRPVARRSQIANRKSAILHLGTMFWPPNVTGVLWFAREVLPLIWAQVPDARFCVVGKNPPAAVTALGADPRIEVAGYVADPWPYLEAADAFVVPLFSGGGMRVKIVDAWLWGLPIVSTPIGAEGIEVQDGGNILLAGDAAAFAAATVRLLTDGELNGRLRANGRRWVEERYAWQVVYGRVDDVYQRLLGES